MSRSTDEKERPTVAGRRHNANMGARLGILTILLALGSASAAQTPSPAPPRDERLAESELAAIADGWSAFMRGDLARAGQRAADIRARDPRNVHALLLGVEVEIARAGARAALAHYESWLAERSLDDAFALRRIARAVLFETTRGSDPSARIEALSALAAAGDPKAHDAANAALIQGAMSGGIPETRVLAASGQANAIKRLSEDLQSPIGNKLAIVDSLVKSGKPEVVQPLVIMLRDARPEHRAAAADGLGKLGARDQIPALRSMFESPTSTPIEQIKAAGALLRLNDDTGYPRLLELLRSQVPDVRRASARALETRRDAAWMSVVRELALDPDAGVRLEALQLLAPYDRDAAGTSLERLMSDPNIAVREEALRIYVAQIANDFVTLRGLLKSPDAVARAIAARRVLELTR
jgi:HEAT repeat protein